MNGSGQIKVWDPLVRIFHWGLVAAVTVAYLVEEDWIAIHTLAGYTVLGLVLFRILWGIVGTHHARFSNFVRPVPEAFAYAKNVLRFRAERHVGHNPAAGLMIAMLLVSLTATTMTGLAIYGIGDQAGPMAGLANNADPIWEDVFEEIHEFFASLTVLLALTHVGGVLVESVVHRENLVYAMFSGRKRAEAPPANLRERA